MTTLRTIFAELFGLFVDDWIVAVSILAWVGVIALLRTHLPNALTPALLFFGLAAQTLFFVLRRARN